MSDPLAYFLTWTTYGTWLPGNERGWVKEGEGFQLPNYKIEHEARRKLEEPPYILSNAERELVEATIRRHCDMRGWSLHAVACRTNHVHVVVSAPISPDVVMDQLKAWCTRRLKEFNQHDASNTRKHWWTEGGSKRYINGGEALEAAIIYVLECQ